MRLLIKQRVFSWTDSYDVYDENENPKYFVKAEFFSLGHQLHVYDRNNHELGVIRQRLLTFLPAFEIEIGGRVRGEIRKQFSFFKPRYEIDYNGWRVEGDFLGWDYDVYNGCSSIIHISKELFHWGDTYTINFSDPQDELEGLMLVIAIDAANCTQNNGQQDKKSKEKIMSVIQNKKKPLVVLTGPTAVGKTKLSIALAKAINGEILSADSMQVYKHMDIGSAKIRPEEMEGVPHHLIDILEPWEEFNVVVFQKHCLECMEQIYDRSHIPILVGGTGFYIQAVLRGIDFTENEENTEYRKKLELLAEEQGPESLHEMLKKVDPVSAENIHANNIKRTIRALEYYELTGEPISVHNEREKERTSPYNFSYFVLTDDREKLYARIEDRIDEMMSQGLVDEVRQLKDMGCRKGMTSMQGLGYKEILEYLDGECSLEDAVYTLKRDTRHFAKRQLTWFRRESEVTWIDKGRFDYNEEKILEYMIRELGEKEIYEKQ